jgi:hypothetical protein
MEMSASVPLQNLGPAGQIRVPAQKRLEILEAFDRSGMSGSVFGSSLFPVGRSGLTGGG